MKTTPTPIKENQRIEDAYGNKGRVINAQLRNNVVRVRMDDKIVRDYDVSTIKPVSTCNT